MSSKSKKRPQRLNVTAVTNRCLLMFVWAWVSIYSPTVEEIMALTAEIYNVSDSMRRGLINERMIAEQLRDEFGLETDWARRDRG